MENNKKMSPVVLTGLILFGGVILLGMASTPGGILRSPLLWFIVVILIYSFGIKQSNSSSSKVKRVASNTLLTIIAIGALFIIYLMNVL